MVAEGFAALFGRADARAQGGPRGMASAGFFLELEHHLLPDDDWLVAETARLAEEVGLPVVVTNDVHYAHRAGRELHDVVTAIRHGRTLDGLADLRDPSGELYLKSAEELAALPPGDEATMSGDPRTARAWAEGLRTAGELAAECSVELGFEQYRFPGFAVPDGDTPLSYLEGLCHDGARRRYHPMTSAVVRQLAHELSVIEKTGLAEFFLNCWDLMRFAKQRDIPAQGRGSLEAEVGCRQLFSHPGELVPQGPEAEAGAAAEVVWRGLVYEMGRPKNGRGRRERSPTDGSHNEAHADSRRSVKGGLISGD